MTQTAPSPTGIRIKSVLVATDLTTASDRAVDYGIFIARYFDAYLYLLHVVPSLAAKSSGADGNGTPSAIAERDAALLERRLVLNGKLQGLHSRVLVREGDVWQQTESLIRRECVDMLVVGTHGRTGVAKLVLGSVAEKISRMASCPVLTVGAQCATYRPGIENGPVLFPTDFSDASVAAFPYAVSMASQIQAKLVLLHLLPRLPLPDDHRLYTATDIALIKEGAEVAARGRLNDMASDSSIRTEAVCVVDVPESIPGGILRAAAACDAQGIVMGLHRKKHVELSSHLPWSTAYDVICGAHCPVLTVKA